MDATLDALLTLATDGSPSQPATIAALADRLLEVSAQDRIDALARLADDASRYALMRAIRASPLVNDLTARYECHTERHPDFDSAARARLGDRELLLRVAEATFGAIERGHWYAVRLDRDVTPPDPGGPPSRQAEVVRLAVLVTPLDGGRVKE